MFWDDLVRRWRRDNRALPPGALRAAAGNVAVLPSPRPRRRPGLSALFVLIVGVLVLLVATGQIRL